jgi:hypothetical protein
MNTPRRHSHKRCFLAAIVVAIPATLIGSCLSAPPAQAAYFVTLQEVGSDVVATGQGTLDPTDLTKRTFTDAGAQMQPNDALIITGPVTGSEVVYSGLGGPTNFGTLGGTSASSGSGSPVGIDGGTSFLFVPENYVFGSLLSDSSTYANHTLSDLGVTPGSYAWTWGSGGHFDSFRLDIVASAVPAPLIGHGLPVLLALGGLLFGAKALERSKKTHGLQSG